MPTDTIARRISGTLVMHGLPIMVICTDQPAILMKMKFDEDKLSEWIVELNGIYDDYFREDEEDLDQWSWKEDTAMNERGVS